jgi:hypothetical protein
MRYALAVLLALGIGVTAAVPAALAQAPATDCYRDGVAFSCVQPTPVTLQPSTSNSGSLAGATASPTWEQGNAQGDGNGR